MRWSDLTISLDDNTLATLRSSWMWLLGDDWTPLLFSIWGDAFICRAGVIHWLNTGMGELSTVAADEASFKAALGTEQADDWFLPGLVRALHEAGKCPGDGQCFTFITYPVFAEGRYQPSNIAVVPTREHFSFSSDLHQQLSSLPDGAQIRLTIDP